MAMYTGNTCLRGAALMQGSLRRHLSTTLPCQRIVHCQRYRFNPEITGHHRKTLPGLAVAGFHPKLRCSVAETVVLCNHNLKGFTSERLPPSGGIHSLEVCGKCNILGDYCSHPPPDSSLSVSSSWRSGRHSSSTFSHQMAPSACASDGDEFDTDSRSQKTPPKNLSTLSVLSLSLSSLSLQSNRAWQLQRPLNYSQPLCTLSQHDANWVVLRTFHTTRGRFIEESKSKVEDTVKALKEEVEKSKKKPPVAQVTVPVVEQPEKTVAVAKKTIPQRIIAELKHYYHGFRLLFIDFRVGTRLLWSVLNGKSLTRRERRQLVRTTADLFRLVPFLVFIVVPFMEFLLPVALKLFPGMLPSTFKEENREQEKTRLKLKGKLEMAKFLQDTIEEMALTKKGSDESSVHDFKAFMQRIRSSGEQTTNEEILKYSKLFKDEITLDNLQYAQLVALCKLLELQTIGSNYFLRFQLRMKLRQLEADDMMIAKEGLEAMSVWELQDACRSRGMRALGVSTERLRCQLEQWLDLHLSKKVPTSLLLLSRALYLPDSLSTEDQLKATLTALPETTEEEAKVKVSEVAGERVDNKAKLEVIRQEEQAIKQEHEEIAKSEEEDEKKKAIKEEAVVAAVEPAPEDQKIRPEPTPIPQEEILVDKATIAEEKPEEVLKEMAAVQEKADMEEAISKKELEEIEEVLEHVAEERMSMMLEQDELETLKEDVSEYKENLEDLKELVVATGSEATDVQESKGAQRLSKQVNNMIGQMDTIVNDLFKSKDELTEEIEVREVRIKRSPELRDDATMRQEVLDQISKRKANLIDINELLLAMKRLQKISDDTKIQRIVQVLDEDKDGAIVLDDALKVIELLGRENVKVNHSQMAEILELLRKEDILEEEIRLKKEKEKEEKLEQNDAVSNRAEGLEVPREEVPTEEGQEDEPREKKEEKSKQ